MSDSEPIPSTERFSARVADYMQSRPGYPAEIVQTLIDDGVSPSNAVIADIGSGTGLLSKLFLEAGFMVHGVEPNEAMRKGAEEFLKDSPLFVSCHGTAEATGLASNSMDGIVAGQAFHWFDPDLVRREWSRIGKPGAVWAIIWNIRRIDTTPFLKSYEAFLQKWGTDYAEVSASWEDPDALTVLFGRSDYKRCCFDNRQSFDYDGLKGRLLSSSYVPAPESPSYKPMLSALEVLFDEYVEKGLVHMEYNTVMLYDTPSN